MEVLFVIKGGCRLVVDGAVCEMSAGDLMIINSDVPHNSTAISRDAVICGVHLDVRHFERLGLPRFADRHYRCRTFLHGPSFQSRVKPMKSFIARLILDQTGHPEEAMTHSLAAQMLAAYIYRYIPFDKEEAGNWPLRADSRRRVAAIMESAGNHADPKQLSQIAHAQGLTLAHLSRLFKKQLGIGFREYSINLRLDRAAASLRLTKDSIADIMLENAFGNSAVFYRKFRERFGRSPAEYRNALPDDPRPTSLVASDPQVHAILVGLAASVGEAAQAAIGIRRMRHVQMRAPHSAV